MCFQEDTSPASEEIRLVEKNNLQQKTNPKNLTEFPEKHIVKEVENTLIGGMKKKNTKKKEETRNNDISDTQRKPTFTEAMTDIFKILSPKYIKKLIEEDKKRFEKRRRSNKERVLA